MYHDLAPDAEMGSLSSTVRERLAASHFEAHLIAVRKAARVMTVADAVDEILRTGGLHEDTISITFDDGYRAVHDIAYPLLRKYELPATVFITTGWLNGSISLWWEELAGIIESCDAERFPFADFFEVIKVDIAESSGMRPGSVEWRARLFATASACLRDIDTEAAADRMSAIRSLLGPAPEERLARPLDWAQVGEMSKNGIAFSSHTVTHINLSHADDVTLENEIVGARSEIESRIGSADSGFAYTYGQDVSAYRRIAPILARNGFQYACTAIPGANDASSDRFALLRETLSPTTSRLLLKREVSLDLGGPTIS
jgi:peptidoglycan/xylan/chitin deacetylase (PgdA/CDA1 family)